jgi:hypothetical protein
MGGSNEPNGKIIMSGENAEISYNASKQGVGGILADNTASYFEMSGNHAKLNWNQGGNITPGGGIQLYGVGTVGVMSGEYAEIAHNYTGDRGGGVYVGTNAQFTMSGAYAAIKANTATREDSKVAGGVYVVGSFFMEAGEISGNTAIFHAPTSNNLIVQGNCVAAKFTGSTAWIGDVSVSTGDMVPSLIDTGTADGSSMSFIIRIYGTDGGGAVRAAK